MEKTISEKLNPNQGIFYQTHKSLAKMQTHYQQAELVETSAFGRVLLLDNITQVSEKWEERYHETLVHPPLLSLENPNQVLLIGGGDGGTLREILKHASVKRVDFAELDTEVIEFSKKYLEHIHCGSFFDKRVNFCIGDGRAFAENSKNRYDAVIMDMTDPRGPARFLYTKEFFLLVKNLLNPQGIFSMHGESPFARPAAFASIKKTLLSVFKTVNTATAFIPMYGTVWSFFYASDAAGPQTLNETLLDKRISLMTQEPRFANKKMWPSFFAADPILDEATADKTARVISDAEPDFPDDFC